jgi:hypothetical protein
MQPDQGVRLAIDCGASGTSAVLAWPDGRWHLLTFDGSTVLPSAVYVPVVGDVVTGVRVWDLAREDPDRFVVSPLRAGLGTVTVAGREIAVQDAVVALLRRVCAEAVQVCGSKVGDVRMVMSAECGPNRRTWLRQAAFRAGLGQPTLVAAPVAAAAQLLAQGLQVRAFLLFCDAGAGLEVSVLRRGPTGFEVLSAVVGRDAGGDRIDQALIESIMSWSGDGQPAASGDGWALLASVRSAKESLGWYPAVTVAVPPPRTPVVLNTMMLGDVVQPVAARAAEAAAEAVKAAELSVDQLAGVYCIGASAQLPAVPQAIGDRLGVLPTVVSQPGLVAVFGALQAGGHPALTRVPSPTPMSPPVAVAPTPPLRRAVGMIIPAVVSLVLVWHFLGSADYGGGGSREYRAAGSWVIANWGELAVACVLALVGCLSIGSVMGAVVGQLDRLQPNRPQRVVSSQVRVGTGILAATAAGVAVAGLYAVGGSLYLRTAVGPLLRWGLLPVLPVAVIAVVIAVIAARWARQPVQGWDGFLTFPLSSALAAGAGTALVQAAMTARVAPEWGLSVQLAGRVGGLLLGFAVAAALAHSWVLRLIIGLPLGVFLAAVVSWPATGLLAVMYTSAVALWWARRLWDLLRSPAPGSPTQQY